MGASTWDGDTAGGKEEEGTCGVVRGEAAEETTAT